MVVIDHGFGIVTRYGTCPGSPCSRATAVERGQVIGYVGATGRATGPHLHYEMLVNGQLTNPLPLLTGHADGPNEPGLSAPATQRRSSRVRSGRFLDAPVALPVQSLDTPSLV